MHGGFKFQAQKLSRRGKTSNKKLTLAKDQAQNYKSPLRLQKPVT